MRALALLSLAPVLILASVFPAGPTSRAAESSVGGLAEIDALIDQGRYAEAESRGRALLDRTAAESGQDSLAAADALMALVTALLSNGKASDPGTLAYARQAHAIQTSRLDASDPTVALGFLTLGHVYYMRGDYPSARIAYEKALSLREQARVPLDERTVKLFEGLANLSAETGDYATSRVYFEKGLAALDRLANKRPASVVGFLNNYGTVLSDLGDLEGARAVFERALDLARRELGEDHPRFALVLDNMGAVLENIGDLAAARSAFERALAIREARLGPDSPQVAVSLSNLASVLLDQGDPAAARPLYERALKIRETALGPAHPLLAITLTGLARTLVELGEPGTARSLLERALRLREEKLGTQHPFYARSLIHLASLDYRTGDEKSALDGALRAEEILRGQIERTARYLSDRQALEYRTIERSGLDMALAAGAGSSTARTDARARRVWEAVIRSRALILDEITARHRSLLETTEPDLASRVRAWDAARASFAALVAGGPGAAGAGNYRDVLRRARAAADRAEREVATRSATVRREQVARSAGLEEIRKALPARTALVAYARFQSPRQGDRAAEPLYVAFVLPPRPASPVLLVLGPAGEIDDLVRRFRIEVGTLPKIPSSLATCRQVGATLRRLVWDPVAEAKGEATSVFLVPDGDLHLLNFATLPTGQDGYLLESGPVLHYLSAERDILSISAGGRDGVGVPRSGSLLALGGLDFGDQPNARTGDDSRAVSPTVECAGLRSLAFRPLPGSQVEVEEIGSLWTGLDGSNAARIPTAHSALLLTGPQGSEIEFKKRAPGRRVIHLATHGFSLDDVCRMTPKEGKAAVIPVPDGDGSRFPVFGLALADANRREHGTGGAPAEDGILTAEEIAALDLRGVEWVVLSGCQTGVGPALRGEGVLGLRRAFRVAGARTVVMSLWAVSDHDALEWILELYRARLAGQPTAAAVRAAALRVLENRRRSGVTDHPHFWGAFVAAGGWD